MRWRRSVCFCSSRDGPARHRARRRAGLRGASRPRGGRRAWRRPERDHRRADRDGRDHALSRSPRSWSAARGEPGSRSACCSSRRVCSRKKASCSPGFCSARSCCSPNPDQRPVRSLTDGFAFLVTLGVAMFLVRALALHDAAGTSVAPALVGVGHCGRALTMLSVVPQWRASSRGRSTFARTIRRRNSPRRRDSGRRRHRRGDHLVSTFAAVMFCRRRAPLVASRAVLDGQLALSREQHRSSRRACSSPSERCSSRAWVS